MRTSVENAARLISRMDLPVSDRLMEQLGQILECQVLAAPGGVAEIAASGLGRADSAQVAAELFRTSDVPDRLMLNGERFRIGVAQIGSESGAGTQTTQPMRLFLLMPEARIRSARQHAAWQIGGITAVAVLLASAVSIWLTSALTRSIRDISVEMDTVASEVAAGASLPADVGGDVDRQQPAEVARLSHAFERLLDQLRTAQRKLEQSAGLAATGQLSAAVAHELRNPLSGIKMNARVLADEETLSADGRECLELVLREIDRIDLYLGELLGLGKSATVAQDDAGLPMGPVELDKLTESVLILLGRRAAHTGTGLGRTCADGIPPVRGNADQLRQVVVNLVMNALEAAGSGGRVEAGLEEAGEGKVRMWVTDTGGGIDPSVRRGFSSPSSPPSPRERGLAYISADRSSTLTTAESGSTTRTATPGSGSSYQWRTAHEHRPNPTRCGRRTSDRIGH